MSSFCFWIFLVSAALIIYCYFLFPVLIIILAKLFPRPVSKGPITPRVAVIIPAYNEEGIIRRKIENTLALDYPGDRMEVIVVSDGSNDGTARIAGEYADRGVTLIAYPERRGKVPALLDALPQVRCEVLVFSDASGMLRPDALREMIWNFADPRVGCVCGYYRSPGLVEEKKHGELLYWDYEFAIKQAESRWGTILGATGAMYAVRQELFTPPRPDTINDDFVIPALVVLRGFRTVLEGRAIVDDLDPRMGNFNSRVRVAAGNWQQLFYLRGLLSPARPGVCWQFVSHKVIRMLVPVLFVICAVSLLFLFPAAVAAFLLLALLAALPWKGERWGKLSAAARKFIEGNAASLYGMVLFIFCRRRLKWN